MRLALPAPPGRGWPDGAEIAGFDDAIDVIDGRLSLSASVTALGKYPEEIFAAWEDV